MRYSVFFRSFMRPELFGKDDLAGAIHLARALGGDAYVFDWFRWKRVETGVRLAKV